MKLSERIRPDVDAAPWVVRAVQALESQVEIAESFHHLAVAQRNSAWTEIECLKSAAPSATLAEPLFLLHTGAVYGNERDDWEIEANNGDAVEAYCDENPGKVVGLYLAPQAPPAAVPAGYALVPIEPTPAMRRAAVSEYEDAMGGARLPDGNSYDEEVVSRMYQAMIDARARQSAPSKA